jgi:hypothetical protein
MVEQTAIDPAIVLAMAKPENFVIYPVDLSQYLGKELSSSGAWYGIHWDGEPFPIAMRLGAHEGRVICSGLLLGGSVGMVEMVRRSVEPSHGRLGVQGGERTVEITASALREIPLGLLLDSLASKGAQSAMLLGKLPEFRRPTRLGPHGIPPERLAEVAKLYRIANKEHPAAPVRWMAQQILGPRGKPTPEVTVRRWLQRCRDLELLGPSIPGKAGERPITSRRRRPGGKGN